LAPFSTGENRAFRRTNRRVRCFQGNQATVHPVFAAVRFCNSG
jgi:hypothetical protein